MTDTNIHNKLNETESQKGNKMKLNNFLKAIEIISENLSTQLYINKPYDNFGGNLGNTEYSIRIKDCCAKVINNLIEAGFSLSMKDGLTSVNDWGVK